MSGIIGDNLGRSSGLIKAVESAAGGSWVLLETSNTVTGGSDLTQLELGSDYFTSTYNTYVLIIDHLRCASDSQEIAMVLTDDNGASYNTASDYRGNIYETTANTSINTVITRAGTANDYMAIAGSSAYVGNSTGEGYSGQIWFHNMLDTTINVQLNYQGNYLNPSDQMTTALGAYELNDAAAYNGFKFYARGGAGFDHATMKLYGLL
jgi:hypothetical protein